MRQAHRNTWKVSVGIGSALTLLLLLLAVAPISSQTAYRAPRAAGTTRPDLNGIWQAVNTANWDIQAHSAKAGPLFQLGAAFAVPPGASIVEGNEIPYKPEALARKRENAANWMTLDPEVKCYLPGVPRATYQGYPFQIVQTPKQLLIAYQFANASRIVYMDPKTENAPIDFWMGWSRGRWEGETLVIDVTGFNDQTWFDRAGNYHSDKLHVVERYTRVAANQLNYEATIEDPEVFTRPWKIRLPLYRRVEENAQLLEFKCVEFAERLIYDSLSKKD